MNIPNSGPWMSTYQRCMFTGTKATNCIILPTAFKILQEVALDAIEKFITARNVLYPCGPPTVDKTKCCNTDHKTNQGSNKDKDKDKPVSIPKQYNDTVECKALTSCQSSPEATDNDDNSNATYGNGDKSEDDDKRKFTKLMCMIGMAKQYGWEERNIMNTIMVRAHLEYKDWFIGTIGSKCANYINSDSGTDTYIIGGHG